jgi:hypothetical protein
MGAAFLLAGVCDGGSVVGTGVAGDLNRSRSALNRLRMGPGQRSESDGAVLHADLYSDPGGQESELLPAPVRQFHTASIFTVHNRIAPQLSIMKDRRDDMPSNYPHPGIAGRQPLVVRVTDSDFQGEVLEKLGRLEAKMEMLIGSGQPGRVKQVEDRITQLEKSEIRRGVYDRIVNAAITVAISAAIAMHDRWSFK